MFFVSKVDLFHTHGSNLIPASSDTVSCPARDSQLQTIEKCDGVLFGNVHLIQTSPRN